MSKKPEIPMEHYVKATPDGWYKVGAFKSRSLWLANIFAYVAAPQNYGPECAYKTLNHLQYRLTNIGVAGYILSVLDTDLKSIMLNATVMPAGAGYQTGWIATQQATRMNPYSPSSNLDGYVECIIISWGSGPLFEPFYHTSKDYGRFDSGTK